MRKRIYNVDNFQFVEEMSRKILLWTKKIESCLFKASVRNGWCFLYGKWGVFHVPGERCVPAGGAGKYTELPLDGADHDKGRRCIPFRLRRYREGERVHYGAVLRQRGDRAGDGVRRRDGNHALFTDRPLHAGRGRGTAFLPPAACGRQFRGSADGHLRGQRGKPDGALPGAESLRLYAPL